MPKKQMISGIYDQKKKNKDDICEIHDTYSIDERKEINEIYEIYEIHEIYEVYGRYKVNEI